MLFAFVVFSIPSHCMVNKNILNCTNKEIKPTHKIKNEELLNLLNTYINKEIKESPLLNIVILKTYLINDEEQDVFIKASNFQTKQIDYKYDENAIKPNGYFYIDDVLILIYGDIETFFTKINEPIDILKINEKVDLLVEVHTIFQHYNYRKINIYGNVEEYFEYKGETDKIDDGY